MQQLVAALDARLAPAAAAAHAFLGVPPPGSDGAAAREAITELPSWSESSAKAFLAAVERALQAAGPSGAATGPASSSSEPDPPGAAPAASGALPRAFAALHRAWQLVAAQRALQGLAQEAFRVAALDAALGALQLLAFQEVVLEGAAALTAKQRAFKRCVWPAAAGWVPELRLGHAQELVWRTSCAHRATSCH